MAFSWPQMPLQHLALSNFRPLVVEMATAICSISDVVPSLLRQRIRAKEVDSKETRSRGQAALHEGENFP